MKFWATLCKIFGYAWLTLAGILILIGIIGVWIKEGFSGPNFDSQYRQPFDIPSITRNASAV